MTEISVIIPVYNVEKYLEKCLDSIVNQTFKDIEIICVNDGSNDNSLDILKKYASKDKRIIIITQKNQGPGKARNKGLEIAKGNFLYFMDSDDYISLDALEKLYDRIIKTNSDICICKSTKIEKNENSIVSSFTAFLDLVRKIYYDNKIFNKNNAKNLFELCNIPAYTKLYRHDFIKNHEIKFQEIKTCNDVFFNFYSLACAKSITIISERLVFHRTGHNSITKNRGNSISCIMVAFIELKKYLLKEKMFEDLKDTFYKKAEKCFKYELKQLKDNKLKELWAKEMHKFLSQEDLKERLKLAKQGKIKV